MDVQAIFDVDYLSSLPDIFMHIPVSPVDDIRNHDYDSPTRDFLIQGEVLQFFVVIKLSKVFENLEENTIQKRVDTQKSSEDTFSESDSAVEYNEVEKYTLRMNLYSLFSRMRMQIEILREDDIAVEKHLRKLINNKDLKKSPVDNEPKNTYRFDKPYIPQLEDYFGDYTGNEDDYIQEFFQIHGGYLHKRDNCVFLPNGDLVYYIETEISISRKFVGKTINLSVIMRAPEKETNDDNVMNNLITLEKITKSIILSRPFTIYEGLHISIKKKSSHELNYYIIVMENVLDKDILISNASLYYQDHHPVQSREKEVPEHNSLPYHQRNNFKIYGEFPVELQCHEKITLLTSLTNESFVYSENTPRYNSSNLHAIISWTTSSLNGTILTSRQIQNSNPSKRGLRISYSYQPQDIYLYDVFQIRVTISNLLNATRNLIMYIPEPLYDPTQNLTEEEIYDNRFLEDYIKHIGATGGIFCLQKEIPLGEIRPHSETTALLQCIAISKGLHRFSGIKLIETERGYESVSRTPCEILIK
eukprot:TRINITY_DN11544_c0_g1_i1.p1 TRINITY_DN11544_c0_g1~~TRINITY_DN11544_c0_g1_i1.p1  ORF type:complete len:531 (+),score=83.22 TRINITY_DN11544_c0_g1_i1:10-1602(+)